MRALGWLGVLLTAATVASAAVTVDAEANGFGLDMQTKAKPIRLAAGTWRLCVDGQLYYGASSEVKERPACEAVLNCNPDDVRFEGHPAACVSILGPVWPDIEVLNDTTAYLLLLDRDTSGNSGSVEVRYWRAEASEGTATKVTLDAVANCYVVDMDAKAVELTLKPGGHAFRLTSSKVRYVGDDHPKHPPAFVLIDCNQGRAAVSWDDVGDTPVGTLVLSYVGHEVGLIVTKPTTVRLYIAHSAARRYSGKLTVSTTTFDPDGGD